MDFTFYTDDAGERRYRKQARNGEIYGDGYRDDTDAVRGAVAEITAILNEFATCLHVNEYNGQVVVDPIDVENHIRLGSRFE